MPDFPEPVTLARLAMATRFELVLHGDDPVRLRAAGEEALDEIERLENVLSLYRPTTEIAHVNARAAIEPVRVSVPVFRLLQRALTLCAETGGAFDLTIGPLMQCWGFMGEGGRVPSAAELAAARAKVGWEFVRLNEGDFSVRFAKPGMMIDLGAIGKGYAIDCAIDCLREAGVSSALVHGGTSSIYALGHPPDSTGWKIAIRPPNDALPEAGTAPAEPPLPLPVWELKDEAMSVSAVWGKSFQTADRRFGHVLDPRSGEPAGDAVLAAIAAPSATDTDALSTALLTLGADGLGRIGRLRPGSRSAVVTSGVDGFAVLTGDRAGSGA